MQLNEPKTCLPKTKTKKERKKITEGQTFKYIYYKFLNVKYLSKNKVS